MLPQSHLEGLPSEVLLHILKEIPDLITLYDLLRASPSSYHVFDTYGAEIVEAHLASGILHEYTCALIRIAALIRSSALPPEVHDLDSFRNLYRHETTEHRYEIPRWTLPPLRLLATVPATVLRGVLASHKKNECLMIGCLRFYLQRFQPLQPAHLEDETFEWEGIFYGPNETEYIGAWQMMPEECAFPVHDIGPPTWVEEQRVLRALWRVQVLGDLKAATVKPPFSTWPDYHLHTLENIDVTGLLYVPTGGLIKTRDVEPDIGLQPLELENELIRSVLDYAAESREIIIAPDFLQTKRNWPIPIMGDGECETSWYTSQTVLFFDQVRGQEGHHTVRGWCTPLQHVPWEFFRRLGFAIWCEKRMFGYGLLENELFTGDQTSHNSFQKDSVFMAWKSILRSKEIAELERINKEWHDVAIRQNWY